MVGAQVLADCLRRVRTRDTGGAFRERFMLEAVLFYVLAIAAVVAGVAVVTRRNPISSAVALVVCFFFLSAMYVLLGAHFVAVMQVLVYAGAIMVLFIFVIMLLNLRDDENTNPIPIRPRAIVGLGAVGLTGLGLVQAIHAVSTHDLPGANAPGGTIEAVGKAMFGGAYLLPFEVASAVLTVAMIGAVVLAKRDI
jgi:NADH-quinone oxidoreductase subunit J